MPPERSTSAAAATIASNGTKPRQGLSPKPSAHPPVHIELHQCRQAHEPPPSNMSDEEAPTFAASSRTSRRPLAVKLRHNAPEPSTAHRMQDYRTQREPPCPPSTMLVGTEMHRLRPRTTMVPGRSQTLGAMTRTTHALTGDKICSANITKPPFHDAVAPLRRTSAKSRALHISMHHMRWHP
jgi:hypothetical protein